MKLKITCLLLIIAATGWTAALDMANQWDKARRLYYQGLESKESLNKAIELFSQLSENSDNSGVAQTYLGSLTALQAQFTPWPRKKLKFANEGLEIMDEGLRNAPDNLEALFIHGTTCYYLPFFFNRKDDANRAFSRILDLLPEQIENYDPKMSLNILDFILEKADLEVDERATAEKLKQKVMV